MLESLKNLAYFILYISSIGLLFSLKNQPLTKRQTMWFNITRIMIIVVAIVLLANLIPDAIHSSIDGFRDGTNSIK
ncbi:hypothetical protein [Lentilactobacillus kosonis]|uniref:Uncharacterized protein n=1 Tax=Lentilactobacillus kosonis TaxID=2810561 RepID=A0A401FIT8_9LACO|nr:hypothetical protein [Lentilactobacillus kosonis]GAY72285.1 hypothetical protein NBRC111893_431 [Lentilactobacillus kosonis]